MHAHPTLRRVIVRGALAVAFALCAAFASALHAEEAFLPRAITSSTIPANGDLNPYGVAFVPPHFRSGGAIRAGDVLVSNFNNAANLQGTGTTIVRFRPSGALAPPGDAVVFFTSPLVGLSTALGALEGGFVIVGNVSTTDGTSATVGRGALQVIDRTGALVATWADPVFLDGPWDLTIDDHGTSAAIFVANVLNGIVVRLDVAVGPSGVTLLHKTKVAVGYKHATDPAALVLGPTGLAFDAYSDMLYVASTADNAVYAVDHARTRSTPVTRGATVFADSHLRGPLAMRFAPNGDLLVANGDAVNSDVLQPSEIVEFTRSGMFVRQYNVDASQGGAFGIDTVLGDYAPFNYAAIDDVANSLTVTRIAPR